MKDSRLILFGGFHVSALDVQDGETWSCLALGLITAQVIAPSCHLMISEPCRFSPHWQAVSSQFLLYPEPVTTLNLLETRPMVCLLQKGRWDMVYSICFCGSKLILHPSPQSLATRGKGTILGIGQGRWGEFQWNNNHSLPYGAFRISRALWTLWLSVDF